MCKLFCIDLRLPFFATFEPDGRELDLDKAFSVREHRSLWKIIIKFIFLAFIVLTWVLEWSTYKYPAFYMSYWTRWNLVYHNIYIIFSFVTVFYPKEWMIKATWLLFSLVCVTGTILVLLFWITEYDADFPLDIYDTFTHAGIEACVLIDGFIINRTPIRLKHVVISMVMALLFILWSIIQGLAPVENPNNEPDENEAMYKILDWQKNPGMSAGISSAVVFVAIPILNILFWAVSLPCRTYKDDKYEAPESVMEKDYKVEEKQVEENASVMEKGYKDEEKQVEDNEPETDC